VVISTGDKDLTQLVQPRRALVNTMSEEVLDEAGVLAKFGVPPERIVDYLALVGDSVDNVPGVEKCGPKTAVKWLHRVRHARQARRQRRQGGRQGRREPAQHLDFLPLGKSWSRWSATCPCRWGGRPRAARRPPDKFKLAEGSSRVLEFKTWLTARKIGDTPISEAATTTPGEGGEVGNLRG
jgi:DNA polymerase-1